MISDILEKIDIIDSKLIIEIDNKTVTINRVTNLQITRDSKGLFVLIFGDESPDEDGKIKHRFFKSYENSTNKHLCEYTYTCNYESIIIHSYNLTSFTVIKQSKDKSYFNRLSLRD